MSPRTPTRPRRSRPCVRTRVETLAYEKARASRQATDPARGSVASTAVRFAASGGLEATSRHVAFIR
jgi:hypothetical protein